MSSDADGAPGRVVVGVDGSHASVEAVMLAAGIAGAHGLALDVVTVCTRSEWSAFLDYDWELELDAVLDAGDALMRAFGPDWPPHVSIRVRQGLPAHVLLAESANAEVLVLGNHQRARLSRVLFGSTSDECRKRARCPVLLVNRHGVVDTISNTRKEA